MTPLAPKKKQTSANFLNLFGIGVSDPAKKLQQAETKYTALRNSGQYFNSPLKDPSAQRASFLEAETGFDLGSGIGGKPDPKKATFSTKEKFNTGVQVANSLIQGMSAFQALKLQKQDMKQRKLEWGVNLAEARAERDHNLSVAYQQRKAMNPASITMSEQDYINQYHNRRESHSA